MATTSSRASTKSQWTLNMWHLLHSLPSLEGLGDVINIWPEIKGYTKRIDFSRSSSLVPAKNYFRELTKMDASLHTGDHRAVTYDTTGLKGLNMTQHSTASPCLQSKYKGHVHTYTHTHARTHTRVVGSHTPISYQYF